VNLEYNPDMTVRDRAINAISELPENADIQSIMRELAFLAGIEQASLEVSRGAGMDADTAKKKLREWIAK
jgi:hypothetical protein